MHGLIKTFFGFVRGLYEAYIKWNKDDAPALAAALSYYVALSFFPFMLLLLSVTGFLLKFTGWGFDVQLKLLNLLADNAAPSLAEQVNTALSSVKTSAAISGPIGLVIWIAASMAVFAQFERAFDRIWNVPEREYAGVLSAVRHILFQRLRAFLLLLCVWVMVIAAFLGNLTMTTLRTFASEYFMTSRAFWSLANIVISVTANWLLLTLLYQTLPKVPVRWKAAAAGGLLASVIWEVGRRVLSEIVIGTHYSVYGVVGAFLAVMLWVYYAAATIFFAAEFVRIREKKP